MVFVRHQGFNAAATVVERALRRLIFPGASPAQTAGFRNGPGQVGDTLLCVSQLVSDETQLLPKDNVNKLSKQ